jgi:hypothetical protein
MTQSPGGVDDIGGEQWLGTYPLIRWRSRLWVAGELATDILCAFGKADWGSTNIFPALLRLHLEKPLSMHGPLWNALVSFSMSRRLSGSPVEVYARE